MHNERQSLQWYCCQQFPGQMYAFVPAPSARFTEPLTSSPAVANCRDGSEFTAVRCNSNITGATTSTVHRACTLAEPGSGAQQHTRANALMMCGRSSRAGSRPPAALKRTRMQLPPAPPSHSSAACCRPSTHRSVLTGFHAHRVVFSSNYGTRAIRLLQLSNT